MCMQHTSDLLYIYQIVVNFIHVESNPSMLVNLSFYWTKNVYKYTCYVGGHPDSTC